MKTIRITVDLSELDEEMANADSTQLKMRAEEFFYTLLSAFNVQPKPDSLKMNGKWVEMQFEVSHAHLRTGTLIDRAEEFQAKAIVEFIGWATTFNADIIK